MGLNLTLALGPTVLPCSMFCLVPLTRILLGHCVSVQVRCDEIVSQQQALDKLIAETPSVDRTRTHLDDLNAQFTELMSRSSDLANKVKSDIASHQSWCDLHQICEERIAAARSKLANIDAHGDKIAIYAKVDSVQVLF